MPHIGSNWIGLIALHCLRMLERLVSHAFAFARRGTELLRGFVSRNVVHQT